MMREQSDFRGRPSFFFEHLRSSRYERIARNLTRRFKLRAEGKFVDSAEAKLQEYSSGALMISIEWTDKEGFSIHSRNSDSDELVRQMATYIEKKYRA